MGKIIRQKENYWERRKILGKKRILRIRKKFCMVNTVLFRRKYSWGRNSLDEKRGKNAGDNKYSDGEIL